MLICNHCNTKNLDVAKFCKECGNSDLYDPQAEEKLEEKRRLEEEKRKMAQTKKRIYHKTQKQNHN
ncbi:zinc-ribbon domain-containing protein [Campylobacter coli]|uniref:zinc-ribbon domain-containing protein n=1 Tax=Campylobacter coli TaxID=195 RepID=UPI0039871AE0